MTDRYAAGFVDGMAAAVEALHRIVEEHPVEAQLDDAEPPGMIIDHPKPDAVWAEHVGFVQLPEPTD